MSRIKGEREGEREKIGRIAERHKSAAIPSSGGVRGVGVGGGAADSFWEHFLLMSSQSNLADNGPEQTLLCHSPLRLCSTLRIHSMSIMGGYEV